MVKIANCKCGAGLPAIYDNCEYKQYLCPNCSQSTAYCRTLEHALECWNAQNTDQHGQQLKRHVMDWIEWDGNPEHLPPLDTSVAVRFDNGIISTGTLMIDDTAHETEGDFYFLRLPTMSTS